MLTQIRKLEDKMNVETEKVMKIRKENVQKEAEVYVVKLFIF